MTIKDWGEIGAAAVLTAMVTVGVLSTRPGMSVDPPPAVTPFGQTASVGQLTVTGTAHDDAVTGVVKATVHIANPTNDVQDGKFNVVLTQMTFTGSPSSRVMRPSDYKTTQIGSNAVDRSVPAHGSVDIAVSFKALAQHSAQAFVTPNYQIEVENNGKESQLGFVTFDVPAKASSGAAAPFVLGGNFTSGAAFVPGGFGAQTASTVRP